MEANSQEVGGWGIPPLPLWCRGKSAAETRQGWGTRHFSEEEEEGTRDDQNP